jgi:hypothetical protein
MGLYLDCSKPKLSLEGPLLVSTFSSLILSDGDSLTLYNVLGRKVRLRKTPHAHYRLSQLPRLCRF